MTSNEPPSAAGLVRALEAVPPWGAALALTAFVLLVLRLAGLGDPMVFSDEYSYAAWTKSLAEGIAAPALAPKLDNWLFLRIFELSHAGEGSALFAARMLNAALVALSAVAIFRMAAPWVGARCSAVLGLAYSVLFGGAVAGFFMPEAGLAAAAALVALAFSGYASQPLALRILPLAAAGAAVSLMKAHGLLLLPAVAVGVLLAPSLEGRWSPRRGAAHLALLLVGWLLGVSLLKGLLGGGWSLDPLGEFYSDVAADSAGRVGASPSAYWPVAVAHLATLALVAGAPLLFSAGSALRFICRRSAGYRALDLLNLVLMCAFAGMLIISIAYTVSEAGGRPYETLGRVHGRYYEHLLLLAAIGGAMAAPGLLSRSRVPMRAGLFFAGALLVALAYHYTAGIGWQPPNDFTSAYALQATPTGRWYGAAFALLALAGAAAAPARAHWSLACGLVAWLMVNAVALETLRYGLDAQAGDRAGAMVAMAEADGDRAPVLIVGSGYTPDLYRVAFHLLDEDVAVSVGQPDNCVGSAGEKRWVVVLDQGGSTCGHVPVARFDGIVVARQGGSR